jgi:hypothetical protein
MFFLTVDAPSPKTCSWSIWTLDPGIYLVTCWSSVCGSVVVVYCVFPGDMQHQLYSPGSGTVSQHRPHIEQIRETYKA